MNQEAPKVEIKVSHDLSGRTDALSLLTSAVAYARTARSSAMLLRDLACTGYGKIELDVESLHLAMSSQVALADAIIDALSALADLAKAKAKPASAADEQQQGPN